MFNDYSLNELVSLYKSLRGVTNNLLCNRCEGMPYIGAKKSCVAHNVCKELFEFKADIFNELVRRGWGGLPHG